LASLLVDGVCENRESENDNAQEGHTCAGLHPSLLGLVPVRPYTQEHIAKRRPRI
jgi:hypothetical protein